MSVLELSMLVIPCVGNNEMVYHSDSNNCGMRCFVDQLGIQYVLALQIFSRFSDIFFHEEKKKPKKKPVKQINFMISTLSVNLPQFIKLQLGNECLLCIPH